MAADVSSADATAPPTAPSDDPSLTETIEERCFAAALVVLEGHFTQSPPVGPKTAIRINSLISKTLEKTHTLRPAREALSRNVGIWIWLTRIFAAAIPSLTARSVGPLSSLNDPDKGVSPQESTALIVVNHGTIKEDLGTLIKLMHIARNLLVNAEPEVPQDLCAAVHFDQMVYQTIILCVNVTSKGYDGEILDDSQRQKLTEVTELYKKLLVTSLQQAHNWTAKHDRNKMSFWFDILFDDEDGSLSGPEEGSAEGWRFKPDVAKQQVQHWLDRNSKMCDTARKLLQDYTKYSSHKPPGPLAPIRPLAWNWLPEGSVKLSGAAFDTTGREKISPVWKPDEPDHYERDRAYGRVSREIDTWWLRARDPNYENWVVDMPSVEFAQTRLQHCKSNLVHRFAHPYAGIQSPPPGVASDATLGGHCHCRQCHSCPHVHVPEQAASDEASGNGGAVQEAGDDDQSHLHPEDEADYVNQYVDEMLDDDEDVDDDVSYGEGPLTGLLTEVPNILDPKQIEALHMIIKSCILDNAGSGLSSVGENIQKTRCRMFLALDCGKSLLRELLVFIAVWDQDEQSLIFQVTTQIVEALHHNALMPYAWNTLRIPKDVISPAQTVLLRLVNHMFRSRMHSPPPSAEVQDSMRDIKLVHFFFSFFRSRVVPDCAALMHLQAQIREQNCNPADFPVDSWDMERAKDGLSQYLDFLTSAAEVLETRQKLIEWEAVYDIVAILSALEAGVPKKPLADIGKRKAKAATKGTSSSPSGLKTSSNHMVERPYSTDPSGPSSPPPPPPPPLQEPAHKFPWTGIKAQLFTILATMLQPPPGQTSPGNAMVQFQVIKYNGIVPLLNSCAYDDHNPFAKERVAVCLKWLLDGCEAANRYIRDLVSLTPHPSNIRASNMAPIARKEEMPCEVRVQVRPARTSDAMPTTGGSSGSGGAASNPSGDAASNPSGVSNPSGTGDTTGEKTEYFQAVHQTATLSLHHTSSTDTYLDLMD